MTDDHSAEAEAAVAAVRREALKATLVVSAAEATCVLLALNLAASLAGVPVLDRPVGAGPLAGTPLPAPTVGNCLAVAGGAVAFAVAVRLRRRRPPVERFEAANPEVAEALRTARDTLDSDREGPMAAALYRDVLDRLRDASGRALLDTTRLTAVILVAFVLSAATVGTAVVGIDVPGSPAGPGGAVDGGGPNRAAGTPVDLNDGDAVLGEETNVSAGEENVSADVGAGPGGEGERNWSYDRSPGADGDGVVQPERAGYADAERVEEADLVRRYAEARGNTTEDDR